uniref:Uncharacterized protein n=1 Tax=Arundo donax TaxID=35708 RepID=A0A0A9GQP3_ARUDO
MERSMTPSPLKETTAMCSAACTTAASPPLWPPSDSQLPSGDGLM